MARARHLPARTLRAREEFIARERKAWSELKRLWARLPEAALLRPGANGEAWSAKDIFNHVAAWQEAALRVIPDLQAGRWGRLGPNTDKFNAMNCAADQARPLAESRQRLNRSRLALLKLLATVADEQLLGEYGPFISNHE